MGGRDEMRMRNEKNKRSVGKKKKKGRRTTRRLDGKLKRKKVKKL